MSFLFFLRDRVVPYLFLLLIVIGGLGSIGWIFANTYFWNTANVIFLVDEEIISAKIDIEARILYQDFTFFQTTYPFHIVLPYTREVTCSKECIFSDIPAGDTEVTFITQAGAQQNEKIVIRGDTQWIIDIRMPIRVKEIPLAEIPKNQSTSVPTDIVPQSIFYTNTVQGLLLFYDKGLLFLHDSWAQQNILLTTGFNIRSALRGVESGTYYLITDANEAVLFDRYGRKKTEKITHSLLKDKDLIWELRDGKVTTKLMLWGRERIFFGRLFWVESGEKYYLSDGEKILEIINN